MENCLDLLMFSALFKFIIGEPVHWIGRGEHNKILMRNKCPISHGEILKFALGLQMFWSSFVFHHQQNNTPHGWFIRVVSLMRIVWEKTPRRYKHFNRNPFLPLVGVTITKNSYNYEKLQTEEHSKAKRKLLAELKSFSNQVSKVQEHFLNVRTFSVKRHILYLKKKNL